MELYIRNQDKTILTKINEDIYVYDNLDKTSTIKTDKWQLGTYKTKERALEVLDEIQNLLKPTYIIQDEEIYNEAYGKGILKYREKFKHSNLIFLEKGNVKIVNNDIVYVMPKE